MARTIKSPPVQAAQISMAVSRMRHAADSELSINYGLSAEQRAINVAQARQHAQQLLDQYFNWCMAKAISDTPASSN